MKIKALIILSLAVLLLAVLYFSKAPFILQSAEDQYFQGIETHEVIKREESFNAALFNYLQMEKKYNFEFSNGKLYNNIGLLYYELEQYPEAIFYFYKAKALNPRSTKTASNLEEAQKKLNIKPENKDSIFQSIFFFQEWLSLRERLLILNLLIVASFICAYFYIKRKSLLFKNLLAMSSFITFCFLGSVMFSKYLASLQGVVLQPTMVYSGQDIKTAYVTENPLIAGEKIRVLDVSQNGIFLKIETPDGKIGFIESYKMGII